MFSSKSFIVSGLTFRSLIHFELGFECSMVEVQLHSFACGYSVTSTPFDRNIDENIDQHNLMKILNYFDTSV